MFEMNNIIILEIQRNKSSTTHKTLQDLCE